jgi:peptidoglycan/xylan/chitin deacetylase (PgdA/CDA1 family)
VTRITLHALEGVEPPVVVRVSGDPALVREAAAGLPEGPATPEAIAARVQRSGGELTWGEPTPMAAVGSYVDYCGARGEASVAVFRADPALLPSLQLGSYFDAPFSRRAVRRLLLALRSPARAADAAFWSGVRSAATASEWRRLTRSSYVVLYYHRIAGDRKQGQERLDVSPRVFELHMRLLRRLGLRPLAPDELVAFHRDPHATLPRGRFVLCADDAFRDAVLALQRHVDLRPVVFVPTAAVGGNAPWDWADGEPIASWSDLQALAGRGGEIASHTRTHATLPDLDADELAVELETSWQELRAHVHRATPLLAYPHGRANAAVRAATAAAGYRAAFSTRPGRNGAGTDPYDLRRVDLKDWDGAAAFAWKALTGELVPWPIERWRLRLRARAYDAA